MSNHQHHHHPQSAVAAMGGCTLLDLLSGGTGNGAHQHKLQSGGRAAAHPGGGAGEGGGDAGAGAGSLQRTLLVHIAGNRVLWESLGIHGGVWQVTPERASTIFLDRSDGAEEANADRLSRAMVRRVTLLESHTNIDEAIAVHIDGLPQREFTGNGDGASLFLTGEGHCTQPQELFSVSGNAELGMQWMRMYPRYTSDNLESEGVMLLTGASYYFVHQDHPAVHFLRVNEEHLGVRLAQEPSLEGIWIRVDMDAFMYSVRHLRDTVLRDTPATFDLTTLTVRIAKPDGQTWGRIPPQNVRNLLSEEDHDSDDAAAFAEARQQALRRYFERPLFLTLRLSIEYALPDLLTTAAPAFSLAGGGGMTTTTTSTTTTTNAIVLQQQQQQQQQQAAGKSRA